MVDFAPAGAPIAADCFRNSNGVVYVLEGSLVLDIGGMEEVLRPAIARAWRADGFDVERGEERTAAGFWRWLAGGKAVVSCQ